MKNLTRMQFLKNAGWAIGGATIGHFLSGKIPSTLFALNSRSLERRTSDVTKLVGLGINAPGSLPFLSHETAKSVLCLLDLSNLQKKEFYYDVADAHSLIDVIAKYPENERQGLRYGLISNNTSILLLDAGFQAKVRIDAPDGVDFGGHAVYLPEAHIIVASLRESRLAKDKAAKLSPGRLAWIDCKSGKILKLTPSGGFEPHDMDRSNNNTIVVANYGNTAARGLNDYTETKPSLCEIDCESGDVIRTIPCPSLGAVSHISLTDHGLIGAIPAQLFPLSAQGLVEASTTLGDAQVGISLAEQHEGKIGGSSPILIYNIREDRWRSLLIDSNLQRRAQSIHFHRPTQTWWITFSFSDSIASCTVDGAMRFYSAFSWGITTPRGVTSIGDRIYVSGQERGIAEIDARSGELLYRHDINLFRSTHISAHG